MACGRGRCVFTGWHTTNSPAHPRAHAPRREDLKHLKAKLKKQDDKMQRDGAKAEASQAEAASLRGELPALEARAQELEGQLAKAHKVRTQGRGEGKDGRGGSWRGSWQRRQQRRRIASASATPST